MEIKNKNYYIRCQSCVYFQEIGIKKGNEVTVGELNCTCENVEEMLNDFYYCEYYEKYIVECEEQMDENKMIDNVNHPKHYANSCSIECIDVMQATFGIKDLSKYCVINAYKYLWRYKNKNGKEDLNKAEWYLNKFDELLEESDNKPYSEQITSRYVNVCITLRKWLKMANMALERDIENEK